MTKEEIIEAVKQMTVIELSELVKELEEVFGVSAAAPMAMAAMPGMAMPGAAEEEEKTEFEVVLKEVGPKKIQVIKAVRTIRTDLGLKEAKELVDSAPATLLEAANKEVSDEAKAKLEAEGATVELK